MVLPLYIRIASTDRYSDIEDICCSAALISTLLGGEVSLVLVQQGQRTEAIEILSTQAGSTLITKSRPINSHKHVQ